MKIIWIKDHDSLNHTINIQSASSFLKNPIDLEQAKQEKAKIYVNGRMHYVIGREETKFIFLDLVRVPVYDFNDKVSEFLYQVEVLAGDMVYAIQLSQNEYLSEKWLLELRVGDILTISKTHYQQLLGDIVPRDVKVRFFETTGIHKIEGQYYYVASNCAISKDGMCQEYRALQSGFDLNYNKNRDENELARKFMDYNSMNLRVFYPFHCIAVMAVLRYFLKEQGKRGGVVLWVDGKVSSGKTELAVALGDFFERGNNRDKAMEHLYTTKIKIKELERELVKYQGSVFILDDVKREESVRNRENTKNVTDLLVRSIYDGKVGENRLNATAIITGEYFKEQKSTTSRVLYLNISDFLGDEKNREALRKLQRDHDYLTGFMCFFIKWLLGKMDNPEYIEYFAQTIEAIFSESTNDSCWSGKELSPRMQETYANFALCTEILRKYLNDVLGNMSAKQINNFAQDCKNVLSELIEETWLRCLDYKPVLDMAFQQVLPKLRIRDCRYGSDYLGASNLDNYTLDKDYRGESFSSDCTPKHKLWLLGYSEEYAGILMNLQGVDVLLLSVKEVSKMIYETVEGMMKKRKLPFYPSDYSEKAIITSLLDGHKILAEKRNDSGFNRVINYPVVYFDDGESYGQAIIECRGKVQMIKINLDVSYDVIGSLEKLEMSPVQDWVNARKILRHLGNSWEDRKNLEETFKNINNFSDLK